MIVFTVLFLLMKGMAVAQPCTGTITNYPYFEGFEANNGNWVPGGIRSDWEWGAPSKSLITGAAEGSKCWVTGGLNKPGYNGDQNSWLLSPCFDFTNLQDPEINFKIFWDTEREFDGATLQYTLDDGVTWLFIGNYIFEPVTCESENWYNAASIFYVNGRRGWAGNDHVYDPSATCIYGSGSVSWRNAKHVIHDLGGQPSVRFRFAFGTGPGCNDFNGFAIDAFEVRESPAQSLSFTYNCNATENRKIDFKFNSDCVSSYTWNFGDPSSGNANIITTTATPTHIFSAPGTYRVRLDANFLYGPPGSTFQDIIVIDAAPVTVWPGKCSNLPDAVLSVSITGPAVPYTYGWNTIPPQVTPSISNVGSGSYNVVVTASGACPANATFVLKGSPTMSITAGVENTVCELPNGNITAKVSGGVAPFLYEWNNGKTGMVLPLIPAGNYSVTVTDANGCKEDLQGIPITNTNHVVAVDLGGDIQVCPGQRVYLKPGAFASYTWQDGSHSPVFKANLPGKYYVVVKDSEGCTGSDTLNIKSDCNNIFFPTAISPDGNGINDDFGPIGDLPGVKKYTLSIYDRFGNKVFYSTDPYQKWKGQYKKELYSTNSFAWVARFVYKGVPKFLQGTFILVR